MPRKPSLTRELLEAVLQGFQIQRQRIQDQIADVTRGLGTRTRPTAPAEAPPRKRTMSLAARKRIAAAQRRRWGKFRKASEQRRASAKRVATSPRKRRLSAAGRERIREAARRRWAEFRKKRGHAGKGRG